MAKRVRKTRDVWRFFTNYGYGNGWEHETTELTREAMIENRKAYREAFAGTGWGLRIVKGREKIEQTS